jgi:hypothetical protein
MLAQQNRLLHNTSEQQSVKAENMNFVTIVLLGRGATEHPTGANLYSASIACCILAVHTGRSKN